MARSILFGMPRWNASSEGGKWTGEEEKKQRAQRLAVSWNPASSGRLPTLLRGCSRVTSGTHFARRRCAPLSARNFIYGKKRKCWSSATEVYAAGRPHHHLCASCPWHGCAGCSSPRDSKLSSEYHFFSLSLSELPLRGEWEWDRPESKMASPLSLTSSQILLRSQFWKKLGAKKNIVRVIRLAERATEAQDKAMLWGHREWWRETWGRDKRRQRPRNYHGSTPSPNVGE